MENGFLLLFPIQRGLIMDIDIEYLLLFGDEGNIELSVDFKTEKGEPNPTIINKRIRIYELEKLIDPNTGEFYKQMYFDERLHEILKIEIDPKNNRIIIKTGDRIE